MIAFNVSPRHLVWAVVLSSLAAGSCGRVPGQFEIVNNQVPLDGCLIPTEQTIYRGRGRIDVSLVRSNALTGYLFFPLLKNSLEPSGGTIDSNEIDLNSFAVDISVLGSAGPETQQLFASLEGDSTQRALLHYKTPWSGTISSGGGLLAASVPAFPAELAARLQATQEIGVDPSLVLNLRVRAFGKTTTTNLESDPFDFPLYVCSGCLIANLQPCPYTVAPSNTGNPCNVAQDSPVDCCLSGNDLLCPPPVVSK